MNLKYPVSRSHAAFLFTVDKMFHCWPNSVYMWTFTFAKYQPDHRAMMRWKELSLYLQNTFPLLRGCRVVEVHPGKNLHGLSHGLHFHVLLNKRINIHWMKRKAEKYDFGRIHVRKVTQEEAQYVGKYLTKAQPQLQKGQRRFGSVGWPDSTKVRDIQIESPFHKNIKQVQEKLHRAQMTPDIVHSIYVNTKIYGDYKDWPETIFHYSNRSKETFETDDWRKYLGPREGTGRPQKMLLRSNKQTREESMERVARHWKERARRAGIGWECRIAEDNAKARQRRAEQAAGGKKIFYDLHPGPPRG